jgi:hypothetical protein
VTRDLYRARLDDGSDVEVAVDHRDYRAWLHATSHGMPLAWAREERLVEAAWLAWSAGRRAGVLAEDWEAFDARCVQVELVQAAQPVDPTGPATSAG